MQTEPRRIGPRPSCEQATACGIFPAPTVGGRSEPNLAPGDVLLTEIKRLLRR